MIHSDKGPVLEALALEYLYGGQLSLSMQLIKQNFHVTFEQPGPLDSVS